MADLAVEADGRVVQQFARRGVNARAARFLVGHGRSPLSHSAAAAPGTRAATVCILRASGALALLVVAVLLAALTVLLAALLLALVATLLLALAFLLTTALLALIATLVVVVLIHGSSPSPTVRSSRDLFYQGAAGPAVPCLRPSDDRERQVAEFR
ncbi:hypothetical protein [Altererythrobacter sp. C41]|uniref:hypothetical protein n=1 Tax=Altererythrobacter sp. C41 TaxID=2806021 RepID=UPI0019323D5C|nr:hypothetical protein [Altererythrobacter sp. C41]MBM0169425.1 hypothetical protein [Altererythrobacter sp. C41]